MHCRSARALITKRHHEVLTPLEGAGLSKHLEWCGHCRAELGADSRFEERLRHELMAAWAGSTPPVPVEASRLVQRLHEVRSQDQPRPTGLLRMALGTGAAILLAAGVGTALRGSLPRSVGDTLVNHQFPSGTPSSAGQKSLQVPAQGVKPPHPRTPLADAGLSPGRGLRVAGSGSGVNPRLEPDLRRQAVPDPFPDEQYLDGRNPGLVAYWMAGNNTDAGVLASLQQSLPAVQDDFVHIPLPQVASSNVKSPAAGEAVRKYEKEAGIVDARLFQKVTLRLKAASLEELCSELEKQTGVKLRASRGVQDEKATVFVEERPAREIMREVARLFGYLWSRSGVENAFKYELVQDLKSQLAEQEMRNRDLNDSLLALDDAMKAYGPYADRTVDQLKADLGEAKGANRDRLQMLVRGGGWGALQLYRNLAPGDVAALREGKELQFGYTQWHANRLPEDWKGPMLRATDQRITTRGGKTVFAGGDEGTAAADYPGVTPFLGLSVDRSELGQLTLKANAGVNLPDGGGVGRVLSLATGQSPSTAKPDNAGANKALRTLPAFKREVTLKPKPSCPRCIVGAGPQPEDEDGVDDPVTSQPHLTSADIWEEVHRVTGLPVIADSYQRLYGVSTLSPEKVTLFDALARVSDEMRVRWRKDGDFLLARSTSYFWDKLKEVPNRRLHRWKELRQPGRALSLEQALEIVGLSDHQLNSEIVGKVVEHCWGISEWRLFGTRVRHSGSHTRWRDSYRLLALLSPEQLRRAQQPAGLPFTALPGPLQQEVARLEPSLVGAEIHAGFAPSGWYSWQPNVPIGTDFRVYWKFPVVAAPGPEEALAVARQVHPGARREHIRKQRGTLGVWFINEMGDVVREAGRPPILLSDP